MQRVGEGSFSEVVKCQDRVTGFFYAAKRLKKIYHSIDEIMKSPEIIVMGKIRRHPNILYMLEFHYDPLPGRVTLIFEMMDMSLYDMINNQKGHLMTEHRVKMYLYQLLRGLEHLHKYGVFHRDIKPENILVKANVVKLADLGSIRGIYSKPPYTEYISTRWYRSPECLLTTGFYGPKMDIWAVGCVFYELLTLKPLFPGCNEVDQITKIHTILGPPQAKLIAKFRQHKSKTCEYLFPNKEGTGFNNLLPHVTKLGKEILKVMLVYDPENRSNVKRLLGHRYLNNLTENDSLRQSCSFTSSSKSNESYQWHTKPAILSYVTSEKRRRCKPLSTHRSQIMTEIASNKAPKVFASSPRNSRLNFSINSRAMETFLPDKGDTTIGLINEANHIIPKLWLSNDSPRKTQQINESPTKNANSGISISYSDGPAPGKPGDITRQISPERFLLPHFFQYKLRSKDFYLNFGQNYCKDHQIQIDENYSTYLPQIKQKPEPHCQTNPIQFAYTPQQITQLDGGKRETRLTTITNCGTQIPARYLTSPNIKSPAKKKAKHDTTTKSLGKITYVRNGSASIRRLREK